MKLSSCSAGEKDVVLRFDRKKNETFYDDLRHVIKGFEDFFLISPLYP